jgi:uncharacterized integral membrane protein (TIGR00698 family)
MLLAVIIGMIINAKFGLSTDVRPGIEFVLRRLLRIAIVLLGLQLTTSQIISTGPIAICIIALTVVSSFVFTIWLGRIMRVDRGLTELIAVGTAICGASAIIAANTVTRARGEDVAYALASITLFGSIAMFVYPLAAGVLGLEPFAYGLWAGASIHEVAQVIAAAFQGGREAGEFGTASKLTRVLFLAPLIIAMGVLASRRVGQNEDGSKFSVPAPWFVAGFLALVIANSLLQIPEGVKAGTAALSSFMLTMALGAMGLQTSIARLRDRGTRPLVLGLLTSVFIAAFSLTLILALV